MGNQVSHEEIAKTIATQTAKIVAEIVSDLGQLVQKELDKVLSEVKQTITNSEFKCDSAVRELELHRTLNTHRQVVIPKETIMRVQDKVTKEMSQVSVSSVSTATMSAIALLAICFLLITLLLGTTIVYRRKWREMGRQHLVKFKRQAKRNPYCEPAKLLSAMPPPEESNSPTCSLVTLYDGQP